MKAGLRTLLLAQSSITAIVGATGVYVTRARQGAPLPHVVIEQMAEDNYPTLTETGRFRAVDFDLHCKAGTAEQADALAETVQTFIQDYAGAAGSQTIDAVILDDRFDAPEKPVDGSDRTTHVVTLSLTVQYHPS